MYQLLDTKQAASLMGVSVRTLEDWRGRGISPAYHKTTPGRTGKVLYDPADIEAWKSEHRYSSTSEQVA